MTLNFARQRQVAHAFIPRMIERRWGRIISITGKSGPEGLNAVFSAKEAVHARAKGLSRELGKYGITVRSIPPRRIMNVSTGPLGNRRDRWYLVGCIGARRHYHAHSSLPCSGKMCRDGGSAYVECERPP
jgi:NAD(P)-dependent dehydrogenase (short-subunit alcohol dehydrogenase family)